MIFSETFSMDDSPVDFRSPISHDIEHGSMPPPSATAATFNQSKYDGYMNGQGEDLLIFMDDLDANEPVTGMGKVEELGLVDYNGVNMSSGIDEFTRSVVRVNIEAINGINRGYGKLLKGSKSTLSVPINIQGNGHQNNAHHNQNNAQQFISRYYHSNSSSSSNSVYNANCQVPSTSPVNPMSPVSLSLPNSLSNSLPTNPPMMFSFKTTTPTPPNSVIQLLERQKRRKENHNAVERRRRDHINEMIQKLAQLVESDKGEGRMEEVKLNKGEVLERAVEQIVRLTRIVKDQNERLKLVDPEWKYQS